MEEDKLNQQTWIERYSNENAKTFDINREEVVGSDVHDDEKTEHPVVKIQKVAENDDLKVTPAPKKALKLTLTPEQAKEPQTFVVTKQNQSGHF